MEGLSVEPFDCQTLINILNQGCCLWIGAGVTKFMTLGTAHVAPDWPTLVQKMEQYARIDSPDIFRELYTGRLDNVLRKARRANFQSWLRTLVLDECAQAIVELADGISDSNYQPPLAIKRLATLGHRANPIVNFNIETFSTSAVATGNYSIKVMFSPTAGNPESLYTGGGRDNSGTFARHVIHPHGALNYTGISVLTTRDYDALNGTLAYQVAVHSAFASHLVIVGMSLNDVYLRDQLASFRSQLRAVVWVTSSVSDELRIWAWKNDIFIALFKNIEEFWAEAVDKLEPAPEKAPFEAWRAVLSGATRILEAPTWHLDRAAEGPQHFPFRYAVGSDRMFYAADLTDLLLARNKGEVDGTSPKITKEKAERLIIASARTILATK